MPHPTPGLTSPFARFRQSAANTLTVAAIAFASIQCGDKTTETPIQVPTTITVVSGSGQTGTVGAALPIALVAKVLDATGKPIKDVLVNFRVPTGGGSMASGGQLTNDEGLATDSWTLGTVAGQAQQVDARLEDPVSGTAVLSVSFTATAVADVASKLVKASADSASVNAGAAVTVAPRVRVTDKYDNPVGGRAVTFTVSSGGGVVVGATPNSATDGYASVTSWTTGTAAGPNTLTATSASVAGASVEFFANGNVGPATKLVHTTPAAGATNGAAFDVQPRVEIRDANNNLRVSDTTTVVTMTVSAGATVFGTAAVKASSGLAAFANVGVTGIAGTSYTLTYSAATLTSATQTIAPGLGAAKQLAITTNAAGSTSGSSFATQPAVEVRDAGGNKRTGDNTTVVGMNVSAGGAVVGTATATAVNGTATFANVGISGFADSTYPLTFFKLGLTSATQTIVTAAGAAAKLTITTPAAGAASGAAFTTQPVVAVRDATNNTIVSDDATVVTMTVSAGAATVGTATATANNGVATFAGVGIAGLANTTYTLTFAASALTVATQTVVPTPGAATQLVLSTNAAGAPAGAAFTTQPAVAIRDASGNTRSTDNATVVTMTVSAGASVVGTATATASSGVATFANVGIGGLADSTYTLTFAASSLTSATQNIIVTVGAAHQLVFTTNAAGASSGLAFTTQPVVSVRDISGNTLVADNSTVVTMQVSAGANIVGTAAVTAVNGVATFANIGISGTADTVYTLQFVATNLLSANQTITPGAGVAALLAITTNAAGSASGAAFTTQPVVAIRDNSNNTVTSDNATVVTITVTGNGVIVGTATTTAVNGIATFAGVGISGTADFTYTLQFTSGALTLASQNITPTVGAAAKLLVYSPPPASSPSGATFTAQPVVIITDAFGNLRATDNSTVVTMTVGGDAYVAFSPVTATAVNGHATFSNAGIHGAVDSTYTLTFSAAGLTSATQNVVTTLGAPFSLRFGLNAHSAQSGQAFGGQPVLIVGDYFGNVQVIDNSTVVTVTVSSGPTLIGTTSATVVNGVATFVDVGLTGAAATYTLTYSAAALQNITQEIALSGGSATHLELNTNAAGAASGAAFTTQPVIAVHDAAHNTANATPLVTMTVSAGATVIGTAAVNAVNGVATFTNVGINGLAGSTYTLSFDAPGLATVTQTIVVGTGAPSAVALTTNAAGAASGSAFTTQPVLAIRDAGGNPVTSDNGTVVTMTVNAPAGVIGTATATAVNGVVTFATVGIAGFADSTYTLSFGAPGLTLTSQPIVVTPGAATRVVAYTAAAGAASGAAFVTQPQVALADGFGNIAVLDNSAVVTMTSSSGSAVVGQASVTVVSGLATFTNVGIGGPVATYILEFAAPGLTAHTQNIALNAGAATQLAITTSAASAPAGAAFNVQPIVAVRDAAGNTVTSDNTTAVTMTVSAGATTVGTVTVTAVNGIVTFADAGITGLADTTYTLTFQQAGITPTLTSATQNILGALGEGTQLVLTTNAAGAVPGQAFTQQPVVEVRDAAGNRTFGNNGTPVTMTVSAGATTVGTVVVMSVDGVATFTDAGVTGSAGTSYTLDFGSSFYVSATQLIQVTASVGTQLAITTNAATAPAGAAFGTQPVINILDATASLVSDDNATVVTMTVSSGATVVGTATATAAAGVVTFANVGISGLAGTNYTITFSAPGLTDATQLVLAAVGAAAKLGIITEAAGAPAGAAFTTQPVIAIQDVAGNTIGDNNGTQVYMAVQAFAADPNGVAVATSVNGVVTFANVGINGVAGTTYTLNYAVSGPPLTGVSQDIVGAVGAATKLVQSTPAAGAIDGQPFVTQPVIAIADIAGNIVVSDNTTEVTLAVSAGAVTIGGPVAVTAVNGVATFVNTGVDGVVGTDYTVTYTAPSLTLTDQIVTVVHGPATQLVIDVAPIGAPAGAAFTTQPVVSVRDALNNTVTSDNASVVTMTVSDGIAIVGTATATAVNGVATFTNVGISGLAGSNYTLTFAVPSLTDVSQLILASVGPAAKLAIITPAAGGAPGAQLGTQPVIAIKDAGNNTVGADYSTVVTMSIDGGAAVTGSNTATASGGVATFAGAGIDGAVGPTLTITYSVVGSPITLVTEQIVLGFGAPAQLELVTQAVGGVFNGAFGTQPVVHVQDVGDNTITTDNSTVVTMTVSAGATVVGTATATAVNGVATFADVGISGTIGISYTLSFDAPSLASATQNFLVGSGPPALLALTGAASGAASGAAFTGQPVIEIRDASNNLVTTDNSTVVTATVSPGATLVGTVTATAVNGVATFVNLGDTGVAGTQYDLTFQSGSLTSIAQGITPTFGAPTQLVIVTPAAGAAPGAQFATQPVIAIKDAAGNTVTNDFSTGITISVDGGAAITGTNINMAVGGVSTFQNAGIDGAVGPTFTITYFVSGSSITSVTQQIVLGFGAPGQLSLVTPAAGIPINGAFGVQPVVHVQDIGDNTITTDNTTQVTMSVNLGAGVVGTATVTAVNGVATFTNVGINGVAGTLYTITFSSGALQTATQDVTPIDFAGLVANSGREWFNATAGGYGAAANSVQALAYSSAFNNGNFRLYSTMYNAGGSELVYNDVATPSSDWTRNGAAWVNDPTFAPQSKNVEWSWNGSAGVLGGNVRGGFYGSLQRANELLHAVRNQGLIINNTADTKRAETWAQLMQGAALSGLALTYDKAFFIDENTPPYDAAFSTLSYSSRRVMRDSAVAKLTRAIVLANANSFVTPAAWAGNKSYSNGEIAQVANTMIALTLANYARNATEADAVDWATVLTRASSGITSDFLMVGDGCVDWCPEVLMLGNSMDFFRVSTRLASLLDPNTQIDPYPLNAGGNFQPSSPDKRLGDGSFGNAGMTAAFGNVPLTAGGGTDFAWSSADPFSVFPTRGYWHKSNIAHIRYDASGVQDLSGIYGGNGAAPVITVSQNNLVMAEARLRMGDLAGAVALINITRVGRGNLAPASVSAGFGSPDAGPCTAVGVLTFDLATPCTVWSMLLYEREIELLGVGSQSYYDQRRLPIVTGFGLHFQGLLVGTPREMPVPHYILMARGEALYTWGGTGPANSPAP